MAEKMTELIVQVLVPLISALGGIVIGYFGLRQVMVQASSTEKIEQVKQESPQAVAQADGIVMDSASKAMDMLELVIERINSEHLKTVQRMLDAHEQEMKLCRKEYEGEIETLKATVSQQGERIKLLEEENEKIKKSQTRDAVFDRIQQRETKGPA
jgi:SMC interacting uncharacterized protein involved in chromosome segregation